MGENFPLESSWKNSLGEKGQRKERKRGKKKRKKNKRGVRSSTFSLGFTEIGPLVFVEARGKVHLCDESFAWVQESGVFDKLREVGVSLLLWLFLV